MFVLAAAFTLAPVRTYALFGVGDVVHDPLMMAGMLGQTGAQIAQMVQTYMALQDMKNRVGSLKNIKDWKGLLRRYCKKEIANLSRRICYDIRRRGARISAETPTNPIYRSVIEGRRELDIMEDKFRRGSVLSDYYGGSDYNIAQMDRAAVERRNYEEQEIRRLQAEGFDTSQAERPAAADGSLVALYTQNAENSALSNLSARSGQNSYVSTTTSGGGGSSNGGVTNTTIVSPDNARYTYSGTNRPDMSVPAQYYQQNSTGPLINNNAQIEGSGSDTQDPAKISPVIAKLDTAYATPTAAIDTDPARTSKRDIAANDKTVSEYSLTRAALRMARASYYQEMDAAIDFNEKAIEKLEEAKEVIDANDMKGPEPYLQHMVAQNDTVIQMESYRLRAERAREEAAEIQRRADELAKTVVNTALETTTTNLQAEMRATARGGHGK